ncbi:MAG: 2-C-methyl-D-erythritol 2,4-cyclodiphosphate synthase, partial [Salinivenus sp.]
HRLVPDRPLVLGGVTIHHDRGLAGHSDADVLLHALADALLGAAALGDLGRHFPDTDPEWEGADSLALLSTVVEEVREAGYTPHNVDATLILERPKLRPHIDSMRENIADGLGLDPAAVSVKATTNEGLGAVGAGEGAAVHAVCTIRPR